MSFVVHTESYGFRMIYQLNQKLYAYDTHIYYEISTVDSITDGSNLKKRNLPTNDTSGSHSIASRVKGLRRPAKKKQKQPLDSPGSTQYK